MPERLVLFLLGMLGASIGYYVSERSGRISEIWRGNSVRIRMILFDLFLYLALGGAAVAFIVSPSNGVGAAVAGLGWEAAISRFVPRNPVTSKEPEGWNDPR